MFTEQDVKFQVMRRFRNFAIGLWRDEQGRVSAKFVGQKSWRKVEIEMKRTGDRQWRGPAGQVVNAHLLDVLEDGAAALR